MKTTTNPATDRIENLPDLKAFCEIVQYIPADGFGEPGVIEAFKKLASRSFLNNLVMYELNQINNAPHYSPPGANYTSIELVDTDTYSIDLTAIDAKYLHINEHYLSSLKQDYLILSLTDQGIPYSLYRQDHDIDPSLLDKTKSLTVVSEDSTLQFGDCLYLRQYKDIFKYNKVTSDRKIIILSLIAKQSTTFIWTYNLHSLFPERIAATIQDSRIENICILLSNFQNQGTVEGMKRMLKHPKHNIRWTALKTLMMIDFEEGCKAVDSLIHDHHPEVRDAARKTKELINAQVTA